MDMPVSYVTLSTIKRGITAPVNENMVQYGANHFNDTGKSLLKSIGNACTSWARDTGERDLHVDTTSSIFDSISVRPYFDFSEKLQAHDQKILAKTQQLKAVFHTMHVALNQRPQDYKNNSIVIDIGSSSPMTRERTSLDSDEDLNYDEHDQFNTSSSRGTSKDNHVYEDIVQKNVRELLITPIGNDAIKLELDGHTETIGMTLQELKFKLATAHPITVGQDMTSGTGNGGLPTTYQFAQERERVLNQNNQQYHENSPYQQQQQNLQQRYLEQQQYLQQQQQQQQPHQHGPNCSHHHNHNQDHDSH